jgi:hypothetical protein
MIEVSACEALSVEEIRRARANEIEVVVFTVFGDESSDDKGERIFSVAGVGGSQEEWDDLEVSWLKLTEGRVFHSSDCEAGRGDFANMGKKDRLKLYKDLVNLLISTKLLGYVVTTDVAGFHEFNPDTDSNAPYHHCFVRVIVHFAEIGFQLIPRDKVSFTFDINTQTNFSSGLLYDYMARTDEWPFGAQLDKLSFANRKTVGIQVADMIAREFMKHCDNFIVGPQKYKRPRESYKALARSFRYRGIYEAREYWQSFRSQFQELEKRTGLTRDSYAQWLKDKGLTDCMTNKHRYLIYLEESKTRG